MFVSTVAPVADCAHGESDLDIRSSSLHEEVVERDCHFKSSGIYKVIRYPVLLMNFCGIYVPSCCVCQVNRKLSQAKCHYDTECPDSNVKTLIYVKSVDGHPEQAKVVRGRCPNSDGPKLSMIKKVATLVIFIIHSANTIRYVFILKNSTEVRVFAFSLTSYFILSFYFYLLAACSHANYFHFGAFITALFSYDKTYSLRCDFLRQARVQLYMFCAGLAFQLVQSVLLVYGMAQLFDGFSVQLWPFSGVQDEWRMAIGLFCGAAVFLASGNVYSTHLFRSVVTSLLRCELVAIRKDLSDLLSRSADRCEEGFDPLLKKFRAVCQLRDRSYHVIKHTVATAYLFGVPLVCFVLYGLAVSVCQTLYHGDWEKYSKRLFQKAVLLTNMFTTQTMGMTVYGLFVVDWSTFLMVFGTIFTYGVIVTQFLASTSGGGGGTECHCPANSTL
ncbi:hypothetical protein Btru_049268 [Bulinus truncatus]|nr:hypothetical protein Btru_049268 [Bulinus truncatus]